MTKKQRKDLKKHCKECCGRRKPGSFCESLDCSTVLELLEDITRIEKELVYLQTWFKRIGIQFEKGRE